jgi:4a-hydroxytetrahydrobiopterin dehydratase
MSDPQQSSGILDSTALHGVMAEHPHWEVRDGALTRSVTVPAFADGIALVAAVAAVADEVNHHPDIDIRWTTITFRLLSHSAGGITGKDADLCGLIDAIVDERVPQPL